MEDNKTSNIIFIILLSIVFIGIFAYIVSSVISTKNVIYDKPTELESTDTANNNEQNNTLTDETNADNNNNIENREPVTITTEEIATYSTSIYDNDKNRMHNLKLACSKLNDHIISKGSEFSFNDTLGSMGKDAGYKKATGFDSNGKKIKVYAGGMCQLSSTVYNCALISKFEITERHPHSRRVNYVPKDKDATIYYDTLDLKFINNTENDVKITANTDGKELTVTFYKISSDSI